MKRSVCLLLMLAGCSTAPIADFLDLVDPAKGTSGKDPHGGVCNPTPALGNPPPGAGPIPRIAPQPGSEAPPPEPPAVGAPPP